MHSWCRFSPASRGSSSDVADSFIAARTRLLAVSIFGAVFFVAGLLGLARRSQPIAVGHRRRTSRASSRSSSATSTTSAASASTAATATPRSRTSAFAGIPPTKTCMNCHSQILADSPFLEPVRASFRDDRPLQWTRVHDLPDFVYFNHSIHVKKGVGCATCHGRVDQMPLMLQENVAADGVVPRLPPRPRAVRPAARRGLRRWTTQPPADQLELGARARRRSIGIQKLTSCSTCHR